MITRRLIPRASSSLWTCPACRSQSFPLPQRFAAQFTPLPLQSIARQSQTRAASSLRQEPVTHAVPVLHHHKHYERHGVEGLFSPAGYRKAWVQYQEMLLNKLRELVAGTPDEHTSPRNLAMIYARDPLNASLFNHASAAVNNHFFFLGFAPRPTQLKDCVTLRSSLVRTFGTIENLRSTFLDTAAGMFGPGYVWLVWARATEQGNSNRSRDGGWRILTTYNAGTPYPEAGYRQQGVDMNNQNPASFNQGYLADQSTFANNTVGAFGGHSAHGQQIAKIPPGGTSVQPVLCVSTWEHSYLDNYGIAGKRQYLNDWWNIIDWETVQNMMPNEAKNSMAFGTRN